MKIILAILFSFGTFMARAEVPIYSGSFLTENQWLSDSQSLKEAASLKFPIFSQDIRGYDFSALIEYLNKELKKRNFVIEIGLVLNSKPSGWWESMSRVPAYKNLNMSKSEFVKKLDNATCYDLLSLIRDAYNLSGPFFVQNKILLSPDIAGRSQFW